MGMSTASIYITEKDTIFDGIKSKSIQFKTHTISGVKTVFPVDNQYFTIINNEFNHILYFEKNTSQIFQHYWFLFNRLKKISLFKIFNTKINH